MGEKGKKEKKREGEMEGKSNLRVQRHHEQGGEEQKVAGRAENYDPPPPHLGIWIADALTRSHLLGIPEPLVDGEEKGPIALSALTGLP